MRKLFLLGLGTFAAMMLGGAAQAADMPLKAPPPAAPIMYNWTGFYIGAHIGGAWADRNGHDRFDGNSCFWDGSVCFEDHGFGRNNGRFIAGGQVGLGAAPAAPVAALLISSPSVLRSLPTDLQL